MILNQIDQGDDGYNLLRFCCNRPSLLRDTAIVCWQQRFACSFTFKTVRMKRSLSRFARERKTQPDRPRSQKMPSREKRRWNIFHNIGVNLHRIISVSSRVNVARSFRNHHYILCLIVYLMNVVSVLYDFFWLTYRISYESAIFSPSLPNNKRIIKSKCLCQPPKPSFSLELNFLSNDS